MRATSSVDFDDLMLLTVKVLEDKPHVRYAQRKRWNYLLVDEFQVSCCENGSDLSISGLRQSEGQAWYRQAQHELDDPPGASLTRGRLTCLVVNG